jgi:hypothetical protein
VEFSAASDFDQVIYLELYKGAPARFRCREKRLRVGFQKLTNDMYRMDRQCVIRRRFTVLILAHILPSCFNLGSALIRGLVRGYVHRDLLYHPTQTENTSMADIAMVVIAVALLWIAWELHRLATWVKELMEGYAAGYMETMRAKGGGD